MSRLRRSLGGLGLILVLSLSLPFTAFAEYVPGSPYSVYGPQPDDGTYLFFGKADEPRNIPNGDINLELDISSVSYQSILAVVRMPETLIQDRNITRFYILRNGQRIIDDFGPAYDNWTDKDIRYYPITITATDEYIGSIMEFQVVAVTYSPTQNREYVVAWSNITEAVKFKPLPVVDTEGNTILADILAALTGLQASLEAKLAQLQQAIESIYTPSPVAEARLQAAMDNLERKLPTTQIAEEINRMNDVMERSKAKLKTPGSELSLGGEFEMIPGVPESKIKFLDLTEWKEQVLMFRRICEAAIWVYFFYMLLEKLTPKPRL